MSYRPAARIVGLLLSIACLLFFVHAAREAFSIEAVSLADSPALRAMPLAMLPYLLAYAALAGAWYCLLRLFGLRTPATRVFGIYLTTQIAKYLPGNVGHHIGRVYLASKHEMPALRVGLSMAVEMLLIVAVALLLSLPLAPLLAERVGAGIAGWRMILAIGVVIAVGVSATLYLLRHHHAVKSTRIHLVAALREARAQQTTRHLFGAITLIALALVLAGSSLVVLCSTSADLDPGTIMKGVALVCAAWIVGFATPGAPAGLGVREAVLLAGLGAMFDRQTAIEATVVFRGVSVAADLIAFLCGFLLLRFDRKDSTSLTTHDA